MRALIPFTALAIALGAGCDRTTEEPPDTGARRDVPELTDVGTDVGTEDTGTLDAPVADVGDGGPICDDPRGCWACAPTLPEHFANGCTDATCEPFEVSTTRLPRLNADGSLPPLP